MEIISNHAPFYHMRVYYHVPLPREKKAIEMACVEPGNFAMGVQGIILFAERGGGV